MAKDYAMLDFSSERVGEEDEDAIELSLELSIGGSYMKSMKKSKITELKTDEISREASNGIDRSLSRSKSCVSQGFVGDLEMGGAPEFVDLQRRREIHAMRRREARMKREEKLKRGPCRGGAGVGYYSGDGKLPDACLPFQTRVRNRDTREEEDSAEEQARKEKKIESMSRGESVSGEGAKDLILLTLNHDGPANNPITYLNSPATPSTPAEYVCHSPLQYAPYNNRIVYPRLMPWQSPAEPSNAVQEGKNNPVFRPSTSRNFQPAPGNHNAGHNLQMRGDSEHNGSRDGGGNQTAVSDGSDGFSSSAVSDNQSASGQGGSSSGTSRSHSSRSQSETSSLLPEQQCNSNNHQNLPNQTPFNLTHKSVSSSSFIPIKPPSKTAKNLAKPPKPNQDSSNTTTTTTTTVASTAPSFLAKMPCVSTTGNGPNGKTVTGFLYRYSNTEVSIVCVCHGSSFSPAGFVEHAGGVGVVHPLKHITMVPPAAFA